MRLRTLILTLSAFLTTPYRSNASLLRASPFSAAYLDAHNPSSLFKRQNCPAEYISCASLAVPNSASSCCAASSNCALDNAGNVACCPLGSFCTGIISPTPSPTSAQTGPITSAPSQQPAPQETGYVPNTFYPFPILFSSGADLGDKEQCEAAYQSCAGYYEQCTQHLANGGGFGVTVSGPGGGITVAPGAGVVVGIESATSICASLSGEACPGTAATCTDATGSPTAGGTTTPTQTGFFIIDPGSGGAVSNGAGRWGAGVVVVVGLVTGWGF